MNLLTYAGSKQDYRLTMIQEIISEFYNLKVDMEHSYPYWDFKIMSPNNKIVSIISCYLLQNHITVIASQGFIDSLLRREIESVA